MERHAFIARERSPSVADWQAAVTELGFYLQTDADLKPFGHSGRVP
jgi:hypothetical protein